MFNIVLRYKDVMQRDIMIEPSVMLNEHIIDRGIGLPVGNKPVRGLSEYREKQ